MKNGTDVHDDARHERELADLRREWEKLREDQVRTEQELKMLDGRIAELRTACEAEYRTSDPDELATLLDEKRADNARLVAEYREHLDGLKAELDAVERDVGESGAPGEGEGA